ncbi:rhodanese-like domain-containing protein [Calothrix sp. FACHB-1219]|uniref:rhodanese-like domain-containing protein n=1 Tax=unclassified Calothrix TaxID=2619626 RepID=UPI0016875BBD|nr:MULTISPECIES: rhodanese-like domain-containing protein [unclassified Calothrix]MBD2206035.1 rhodanese-like domain-containing protein [Calothrix sp. FACHB-168]MBD2220790.1 rhodanese-like domain-containing protein [Calothrix sp. FACHB-1219]
MKRTLNDNYHNQTQPFSLNPRQLRSRLAQFTIIDARSWMEYLLGHIPGARYLSQSSILEEIPKDELIVVTCLSGHRSLATARWLVEQGYFKVYNLQGGIMTWQQLGYPLQRGNNP